MSATSSISGVISGLDTEGIISKLREIEMRPVTRLQQQRATLNLRLTAWQTCNTKLLALKTAAGALSLPATFRSRTATVSDEGALRVTVTGSPALADCSFTVVALAQAHQLASQGYTDADATLIGDGAITVNGREITTTGLTLSGLRDAINAAGAGVTASILDTGTGETPYRLVLTSDRTGLTGEITVNVNVSGTAPAFATTQAAQDAQLRFGSGEGAIDVYRSSNEITDVIPGLTLHLVATTTAPVTVRVAADTAALKEKIQALVSAYNELDSFISGQSSYDTENQASPPLFGDLGLMQLQRALDDALFSPVEGASSDLCLLSQAGLRRDAEGRLSLDEATLDRALAASPEGVMKLFASYAEGPSGVSYLSCAAETKPSGAAGYALEITQLATQARVTAGVAMTAALAAEETLTLNGVAIALTAGMSQREVAAAINARASETGVAASFTGPDGTGDGDYLTLTRLAYGSSPTLTAVSSLSASGGATTGLGDLLVTPTDPTGESGAGTGAPGVDVAGFIGGGAATGAGQVLTAVEGDATGLRLLVRAGLGALSPVVFTRGVVSALEGTLAFLTGEEGSPYLSATQGLNAQLEALEEDITRTQTQVDQSMALVERQFQAMEAALAKLQSQSSFLSNQLKAMQAQMQ